MSVSAAPLGAVLPDLGRASRSVAAAGLCLLLVAGLAGAGYLAVRPAINHQSCHLQLALRE